MITNFGDGPVRDSGPGAAVLVSEEDFDPSDEARMMSAVVDPDAAAGGPFRIVSLYAPNGRVVGRTFYDGKLRWFERLARWLGEAAADGASLVVGGDFNVAPTDADVWDAAAVHGGTHVSEPERAAFRALLERGLVDAYRLERVRARPLHVVGLPGRQLPQEPRDADRPSPRDPAASPSGSSGPRSIARRARARRSRPTTPRSSSTSTLRARPFDAGLGRRAVADRGTHEAGPAMSAAPVAERSRRALGCA